MSVLSCRPGFFHGGSFFIPKNRLELVERRFFFFEKKTAIGVMLWQMRGSVQTQAGAAPLTVAISRIASAIRGSACRFGLSCRSRL